MSGHLPSSKVIGGENDPGSCLTYLATVSGVVLNWHAATMISHCRRRCLERATSGLVHHGKRDAGLVHAG